VVWGAVFQRNILLASPGGCLKMEVVCLFRTVSIPDDLVSVWKDTFSLPFGLQWFHEVDGDGVWYRIGVLEVWYPIPHYAEIEICFSFLHKL